ncbi:Uncharacterised protein [Mycobacteroides abscessus subsp. abscessus]|nr:Uncharacterised protein [Mycobacteroides abscessus subsp. abscessus]SHT05629.1 Uncharacterised protein [Mycobacteroides abscessus subsp. abscessus]
MNWYTTEHTPELSQTEAEKFGRKLWHEWYQGTSRWYLIGTNYPENEKT